MKRNSKLTKKEINFLKGKFLKTLWEKGINCETDHLKNEV